ncbi:helix-turn-helix domain-containing protein [Sphingobacterium sp. LRF_L2]|uniref:helix-turn-helix domain-containing protein n=1 Tax=Sphingobacterium sp. LRF_L2 TaxID=3369421 RepID=UPI003F5FB29C
MKTNDIFKKIREEAGLSQVQLAEICETTQGTISHIEKSINSNPSYDIVSKYITEIGANPIFMFGLDPLAPPIIHPTIMMARMSTAKSSTPKVEVIRDLQDIINRIRSL